MVHVPTATQSRTHQHTLELGLVDYLAERFSVAGTVDDCAAKLEKAIDAGRIAMFWMSIALATDKERFLRKWGAADGEIPLGVTSECGRGHVRIAGAKSDVS